jgi:hypothetical protein
MKKSQKMIGYKGFDKDMKCQGFQFEVGKTYTHDGEVKLCSSGFHFCENPLDIFGYYCPADGKFHKVEADNVSEKTGDDSKHVAGRLHIGAELSLNSLIQLGVKFILDKVDFKKAPATNAGYRSAATNTGDSSAATNTGYRSAATNTGNSSAATNTGNSSAATNTGDRSAATNTGDKSAATNTGDSSAATNTGYSSAATNTGNSSAATNTGNSSAATNTGDRSAATNTGDRSAATNTGDRSAAKVEGKESVAIITGKDSKACGAIGCWLVLTERDENWNILEVKTAKVDGKDILPDTFYALQNGKFVAQ